VIEIKSTLRESPIRAIIFGKDGVGKSTFCAAAPCAVFIAVESGLDNIDASATPTPDEWTDLLEYVQALADDDRCGTIVIDSLDWAEQLCWRHVCQQGDEKGRKQKNIESFGYGKGYVAALAEWRVLINELMLARSKGKNVLLIAHAERKAVKNPTGEDYDAWAIKLNAKAASLFREWVDVVGFAELDIAIIEGKDKHDRAKGISTGKRVLRTQPAAGYEAKTRFTLPERVPLDWPSFARAVKAGRPPTIDELELRITTKLADLADVAVEAACGKFLSERGRTFASLSEAIATVDGYLNERKTST
jgi:hypothetical protein